MSSEEGPRGPSKAGWESSAYSMDPYLGLARSQGADARKNGEEPRHVSNYTEATLLPKKSRKAARPTVCQVDGCGRDLSGEKAYLQRYSVCDVHFKADVALVHGQEMRFCQQCNKFQDLREFEGVRRSCAARSKDRNLRRRLQTTLQKGGTAEELLIPSATGLAQQQQQSGSPGRSKAGGGGTGGSDDSGGRAGSGDVSMGGSAAMNRRPPEVGSGGSEYSLDAIGTAVVNTGAGRGGHPASGGGGGIQSRNPAVALGAMQQPQPTGSAGNGGGASSGNPDVGGQEPPGSRAGAWLSLEQMGQSYDADAGLSPSLALALARRGAAAGSGDIGAGDVVGAGCGANGPMLMDLDGFLSAPSSHPYGSNGARHQQAGGPVGAALALDGNTSAATMRDHDSSYTRKLSSVSGPAGWAGPAALSLLDAYDGIRAPQQLQQQQQQNPPQATSHLHHQQQNLHHSTAVQRNMPVGAGTPGGSVLGSWGSGAMNRLHSLGGDGNSGQAGQQQQLTLGGSSDDRSAAMLLEQLQGTVAGVGPRAGLGAARDDSSLAGLLGPGGLRAGCGSSLGVLRGDQTEGSRASSAFSGRVLLQQHQQAGTLPALLSVPSNSRHDDLAAMIKERRAALIRQQLLQQQHRQQQQQPSLTHQQQQGHETLVQQDQLSMLGTNYNGEGPYVSISASDQLQLRMLAAGGASAHGGGGTAAATASGCLDDYYDVAPAFGARAGTGGGSSAMDGLGGGGRVLGAGTIGGLPQGGSVPLTNADALVIGRRQTSLDPSLETVQLLEQYALGGSVGGGGAMGRLGSSVNGVHIGFASGAGNRVLQQHSNASGAGGGGGSSGDGGGGYSRYDNGDAGVGDGGGSASLAAQDAGDRSNGVEGSGGGGSSRLLSVLYPGAGGREDALAARVCLKLFSCMPEELPGDMLLRLRRWAMAADSDVLQIFMRPGCVHLIVNVRLSNGSQAALERSVLGGGDLDAAVSALRGAFESSGLLRGRRVVVQAASGPRGAFEYDGAAGGQARWVSDADLARAPSVLTMQPAALPCGVSTEVALLGRNLRRPGTRLYARCGGASYVLQPKAPRSGSPAGAANSGGEEVHDPSASAADAAPPQLYSPRTPSGEVARSSWTDGVSTSSAPFLLLGGSPAGEDAPPLLYDESDGFVSSWASPDSGRALDGPRVSATGSLSVDTITAGAVLPDTRRMRHLQEQGEALAEARVAARLTAASLATPLPQGGGYTSWGAESELEMVYVEIPALQRHGLVAVEAVNTEVDVMGAWAPGVLCEDPTAAAELNTWLQSNADEISGHWLLKELGVLLDYDAMLPSLLQGTAVANIGSASRRVESSAGAPSAGTGAGHGSAVTVRGGHQRALQQKHAAFNTQQQQQRQQPLGHPVLPAVSNPLPRTVPDPNDMATAAAAAGSGALSAVPYSAVEASGLPPIVSARPDGSLELRLLPSDTSAGFGLSTTHGPAASGIPAITPTRSPLHGSRDEGSPSIAPPSQYATILQTTESGGRAVRHAGPNRVTLSDDTKVPDAPGRLLEPSLRRLLAHPLLHPGCRRSMLMAGARLLSFSVASGLRLLANGLVEWMIALEAPTVGLAANVPGAIPVGLGQLDTEPAAGSTLADVFGKVAARAALSTARGAMTAIGVGISTPPSASTSSFEPYFDNESSHDSSFDSSGNGMFRYLSTGLTLLHLAVLSCSTEMLMQVLNWAEEYGRPWALEATAWPGQVTALHLAVAAAGQCGDGGEAARLLLSLGPEAQDAWLQVRDAAGQTPADIAQTLGLNFLNYLCLCGEEPAALPATREVRADTMKRPVALVSAGEGMCADCGATTGAQSAVCSHRVSATAVSRTAEHLGQGTVMPPPSLSRPSLALATMRWTLQVGALLVLLVAVMLQVGGGLPAGLGRH